MSCKTISAAILLTLAAGAAHAQSASPAPLQTKPALNLSDARVSIGQPRSDSAGPSPSVTNRTSVDHTFGPQSVTASVGYLCGLEPPSDRTPGPASTFGPISTFLGGKLTYAFK
jgi:hypothetical protein